MRSLGILFLVVVLYTLPLWNTSENLAGAPGDPWAHAALPHWYCPNIPLWHLHGDNYMAPGGFNLATSYESPFPLILTCPFLSLGEVAPFHIFVFLQILLMIVCAWLVAREFWKEELWRLAYVLCIWWCGYFFARSTQHFTLLANIWGFQLLLWVFVSIRWDRRWNIFWRGLALGVVFSGSFQNAPLLFVPLLALLGYSFFKDFQKQLLWSRWKGFLLLGGASMLVFLPLYGPALWAVLQKDYVASPALLKERTLDLLSPVMPWKSNLLYQWLSVKPFLELEASNSFDGLFLIIFVISLGFWRFWKKPLHAVLLFVALFSLWFSFGPEFRWHGEYLGDNPLFDSVSHLMPFSLTRTPGRAAVVTGMILVFLGFRFLREHVHSSKKLLAVACGLLIWIGISGPILNQNTTVPVFKFAPWVPRQGMAALKALPAGSLVMTVPAIKAGDQSQDFLWLFHRKNITFAYIAYAGYTPEVMNAEAEDPLLGKMSCSGLDLGFEKTNFLTDMNQVRKHLQELNIKGLIFNKSFMKYGECKDLTDWIRHLIQQPWVYPAEENNSHAVYTFQ